MDRVSKEQRSSNMSKIKSTDTKPELLVRSVLHKLGYRYRLFGKVGKKHYGKGVLPGKPDIVLAKHKIVIFIHGCFWHQHPNCKRSTIPKTNKDFWELKFDGNKKRDEKVKKMLISMGWKVIIIWGCEINSNIDILRIKIMRLMNEYIK